MQILSLTPDSLNQKWGAGGSNLSLENHPDGSAWEALLWIRRSQFCLLKSPEQASIDPALPHSILIFADGPQAPWFRRSTGDCNEQPSWWATVLDVSRGPQEGSVLFEGKPGGIRTDGSALIAVWWKFLFPGIHPISMDMALWKRIQTQDKVTGVWLDRKRPR